jgi:hypothetical protein
MLHEATLVEKGDEVLTRDKMVVIAVDLSRSRGAGGI